MMSADLFVEFEFCIFQRNMNISFTIPPVHHNISYASCRSCARSTQWKHCNSCRTVREAQHPSQLNSRYFSSSESSRIYTYIFTGTHTHRHPLSRARAQSPRFQPRASNENCERAAHVPNDTRLHNHAVTSKSRVRCIRYAHSCSSRLMQPSQNLLGQNFAWSNYRHSWRIRSH